MRVVVVVAAMFFCAPVFAQDVKLKTVTNSIGMKLIEIPAGEFTMGDGVGVAVTLTQSFGLGKTEVTRSQWTKVMSTEPWVGRDHVIEVDKNCPATNLDWEHATFFCQNLTAIERKAKKLKPNEEYRLPTEAEWEYACRAGTTTVFSFGNDEKKLGEYGWFGGNIAGKRYAHRVGLKKSNPWGLQDMHGNVAEWCSDFHSPALSGGTDPVGPKWSSDRVLRGGSWAEDPRLCRSAYRKEFPSFGLASIGFRVARSQSAQ